MKKARIHLKIIFVVAGLAGAGRPAPAAAAQFKAVMKEDFVLFEGPADTFAPLPAAAVKAGESVLVLGNSTGGEWYKVMKDDGQEGWSPKVRLSLQRVSPFELDELEETLERKRRVTSHMVAELGASVTSSPNTLGASGMLYFIPFSDGLMRDKIDQPEIGFGFTWETTALNTSVPNGVSYSEMPVVLQWMFRMPPRGSFMFGPKMGGVVRQGGSSETGTAGKAFDFLFGLHLRYYPYDSFGFYLELLQVRRSANYLTRNVGISIRY